MIVETQHPRFGTVRQLRSPARVGDGSVEYRRAPARGEDSGQVLSDLLGYAADHIDDLAERGAFG